MAKKKPKKYTKDVFKDVVCSKCGLCMELFSCFCYGIYKKNPSQFFNHCYPQLLKTKAWPTSKGKSKRLFKNIFCMSGACGKKKKKGRKCRDIKGCMWSFCPTTLTSIRAGSGVSNEVKQILGFTGRQRRRKKAKKKFIPVAYPTFFCSDNDEWRREIQEALNDNINIEEPNRSDESSGQSEERTDQKANTVKSGV